MTACEKSLAWAMYTCRGSAPAKSMGCTFWVPSIFWFLGLLLVAAGFDAHKKDEINFRYVGVTERDYEWLTDQLVQVANR